jgi:hypothetical protein
MKQDCITEEDCRREAKIINNRFDALNERREAVDYLVDQLNATLGICLNRHQWDTRYSRGTSSLASPLYIYREGDESFIGWLENEIKENS